jgi:hypothetical protein
MIRILFDGPPSHESGRFIEVENEKGESISFGEWVEQGDYWVLQFPDNRKVNADLLEACVTTLELLDHMTTDQYSKGHDKHARHVLKQAIEKAKPKEISK